MAFTDNFTGTNGDLLEDRSGWTEVSAGTKRCTIYNNGLSLRDGGSGSSEAIWSCTDQGSVNHYTQIKQIAFNPPSSPSFYTCMRLVDKDNFICFWMGGTGAAGFRLAKNVATAWSDLVTFQGAANTVIKIDGNGNTVRIFKDSVQQGTDQTITDHNTETTQGLINNEVPGLGDAIIYDDFEAGPMAAGLLIPAAMHHFTKNIASGR